MKGNFDHNILLLQGGGALGAYQAGAYEGLVEAGIVPDWVVGISIGAINAALIAGNPPGQQVERLREFWMRVSSHAPLIPPPWSGVQWRLPRQRHRRVGLRHLLLALISSMYDRASQYVRSRLVARC